MSNICWILTDGRTGTENNSRGLAEALGLDYIVKPIALREPWRTLCPWLRIGLKYAFKEPLTGPWPDLVITAGRTPATGSLYIGQQSKETVRVHITNPGISPQHFDLVIAPKHDRLQGSNVLTTLGALHRLSAQKLQDAAVKWAPVWQNLPRPFYGLLVGGDTKGLKLTPAIARDFMQKIKALGGSSLATASRRTGPEARTEIASSASYFYNGEGENPYFGILALCDALFVTADSVSMLSEAAFTGKPVYVLPLEGNNPKLARCQQALIDAGHVRLFNGQIDPSPTPPLDDMARAADKLQQLLIARRKLPV